MAASAGSSQASTGKVLKSRQVPDNNQIISKRSKKEIINDDFHDDVYTTSDSPYKKDNHKEHSKQ